MQRLEVGAARGMRRPQLRQLLQPLAKCGRLQQGVSLRRQGVEGRALKCKQTGGGGGGERRRRGATERRGRGSGAGAKLQRCDPPAGACGRAPAQLPEAPRAPRPRHHGSTRSSRPAALWLLGRLSTRCARRPAMPALAGSTRSSTGGALRCRRRSACRQLYVPLRPLSCFQKTGRRQAGIKAGRACTTCIGQHASWRGRGQRADDRRRLSCAAERQRQWSARRAAWSARRRQWRPIRWAGRRWHRPQEA